MDTIEVSATPSQHSPRREELGSAGGGSGSSGNGRDRCVAETNIHKIFVHMAFFITSIMRCTLPITKTMLNSNSERGNNNATIDYTPFQESAYYIGHMIAQRVCIGLAFDRFPALNLLSLSVGGSSVAHLLIPFAMGQGPMAVGAINFVQGFFMGLTVHACGSVCCTQTPPMKRIHLAADASVAVYLGLALGFPAMGLVAHTFSWQTAFFCCGFAGLVWFVLYLMFGPRCPNRGRAAAQMSTVPVLPIDVWTKIEVLAALGAVFSQSAAVIFIVKYQVRYVSELGVDIVTNGIVNCAPYLVTAVVLRACQQAEWLMLPILYKTCIGLAMQAICFVVMARCSNEDQWAAFATLLVGAAGNAAVTYGLLASQKRLAQQSAPALAAVTSCVSSSAGIAVTVVVSYWGTNQDGSTSWQFLFHTISAALIISCGMYRWCASSERQPWAETPPLPTPELAEQDKPSMPPKHVPVDHDVQLTLG